MIGCHMRRGAGVHDPLLAARELHVLESCKKSWVYLLLLLRLVGDHHVVGGLLVACSGVGLVRWQSWSRSQDAGGRGAPTGLHAEGIAGCCCCCS
jgi:hypothetical protein